MNLTKIEGECYVLVLNKEQAEALGTLRFKHIRSGSVLYDALKGLPHVHGADLNVEPTPNPSSMFTVGNLRAPNTSSPSESGAAARFGWLFGARSELPIPNRAPEPLLTLKQYQEEYAKLEAEANRAFEECAARAGLIGRMQASPATQRLPMEYKGTVSGPVCRIPAPENLPKRRWIVQFYNPGGLVKSGWIGLNNERGLSAQFGGTDVYDSRNEAYRQMRARSKAVGAPLENYRVVPYGTENGSEKVRGHYTVQYWSRGHRRWCETVDGPGGSCQERYRTAAEAEKSIEKFGHDDETYRVKWHAE